MKKNGIYRYSLQWSESTNEKIRAGEFLEQLGNKKSAVIVAALNDYMDAHPEICIGTGKIEVKVSGYDRRQLEEIIRSMMKEQKTVNNMQEVQTYDAFRINNLGDDITKMLENMEIFNEL